MIFKSIFVYPKYPENLKKLYLLAQNLWGTWNYEAINLFYRTDSQLFRAVNHNPVRLLLSLPKERFEELSNDKGFLFELESVWERYQEYMKYSGPDETENGSGLCENDVVAYFAMEFGWI